MLRQKLTKFFALLSCVAILLSMVAFSSFAESNIAVNEAKKGVFKVVYCRPDSDNEEKLLAAMSGTGFLINEQYVVTAYHVVHPDDDQIARYKAQFQDQWKSKFEIRVYYSGTNYIKATEVTDLKDSGADITVLKLSTTITDREPLPLVENVGQNVLSMDNVYALGYSNLLSYITKTAKKYDPEDVAIKPGKINRVGEDQGYGVVYHTSPVVEGYSGGPVINQQGAVIGITSCTVSYQGEDYEEAILSDVLIKILNSTGTGKNIKYDVWTGGGTASSETETTESDTQAQNPENPTAESTEPVSEEPEIDYSKLQVAVSTAETKSKDKYSEETWNTFEQALIEARNVLKSAASQDEVDKACADLTSKMSVLTEKKEVPMALIIGIVAAVVVIVLIVVIVVVLGKKKKDTIAPVEPTPIMSPDTNHFGPAPQPVPSFEPIGSYNSPETDVLGSGSNETTILNSGSNETTVLSSKPYATLKRKSNGENIQVASANFIMGRERRTVQYCIDDNQSISKNHAKIVKNGAKVAVVDMNSKNGTFVNGIKCDANTNVNLKSGDKIALSDEEFTITIL